MNMELVDSIVDLTDRNTFTLTDERVGIVVACRNLIGQRAVARFGCLVSSRVWSVVVFMLF